MDLNPSVVSPEFSLIAFLAPLGLMLLALNMISTATQTVFTEALHWLIRSINRHKAVTVVVGGLTSFLLQSEVSASLMAMSFSSSGLLVWDQLYAFLLGSNLGTSLTLWLLAIPEVTPLDYWLLAIGFVPMLYFRNQRFGQMGKLLFALGLFLLAFRLALTSAQDLSLTVSWSPVLWVVLAFLASMLLRSSLAVLASLMVLQVTGLVSPATLLVCLLAVNIAIHLPLMFSVRQAGVEQVRGAHFHIVVNLLASLLVVVFLSDFQGLVEKGLGVLGFEPESLGFVPMAHMLLRFFVLLTGLVFWWPLVQVLRRWALTSKGKHMQRLRYFGHLQHLSSALAIEQLHQEVKKMSAMVETILQLTHSVISKEQGLAEEDRERIFKYESVTDNLQQEVERLVIQLNQIPLTELQSEKMLLLQALTNQLESVADSCKSIYYRYEELNQFSDQELEAVQSRLQDLSSEALRFYELFFDDFTEQESFTGAFDKKDELRFDEESRHFRKECLSLIKGDTQGMEIGTLVHDVVLDLLRIRHQTYNLFQIWKRPHRD